MHQLPGILDGTVIQPPSTILVAPDVGQHNSTWVDQPIWAWIFATISKETLCEVHNISHGLPIWQYLAFRCSLGRALDLKCMLTNVSKRTDQSMEDYL